ncbi:M12 family metallopeptidase [Pseudomonas atagonensis]|uniref:M12 family metallopeptidase n=1 Tax=Pseudomonas atagonensis TaxID=2609964 RepID=UPI00140C711E|nr:M12 family metallopeptidase [Pseudomonas atagonensis]
MTTSCFCKVIQPAQGVPSADASQPSSPARRLPRSVGDGSKFWRAGQWLSIAFTDAPTQELQDAIEAIIWEWQPYINLYLAMSSVADAKIRISTRITENTSYIGTDALKVPAGEPTMSIGNKPGNPEFRAAVLHEFGHALGFEHEHQHPEANIPWNKPMVYRLYAEQYGHDKSAIDLNFFTPLNTKHLRSAPYDRKSIMHYPIENRLTNGEWEVKLNSDISEQDIEFARLIYPK